MAEFLEFPKVARLNRDIVITEKIDGTNAAIGITDDGPPEVAGIWAQSRTRLITPKQDNFGFARWVQENENALKIALGPGLHFGEWFGSGIQRGYGLKEKRFALFNTERWEGLNELDGRLTCVPVLARFDTWMGSFSPGLVVANLRVHGSYAVEGYDNPEGIVIFHTASRQMYKVTLENDEKPKGQIEAEARANG